MPLTAIGPDNQYYDIPEDKEQAWLSRGSKYGIVDKPGSLENDINKEQGTLAVSKNGQTYDIPIEKWDSGEARKNGFILNSVAEENLKDYIYANDKYASLVTKTEKQKLKSFGEQLNTRWGAGSEEVYSYPDRNAFDKADIWTPDGKYKMVQTLPDGTKIKRSIDPSDAPAAINAGIKFKDTEYQSMVTAYQRKILEDEKAGTSSAIGRGIISGASLIKTTTVENSKIADKNLNNDDRARALATLATLEGPLSKKYSTGEIAGTILGIVSTPTSLAKAGGKFIKGLIAGEEAVSLGRTIAAKGAEGIAQALIVTGPQITANAFIDKDPKLTGEQVGLAIGVGGLLGMVVPGASKLSQLSEQASKLDNAFKAFGVSPELLAKIPSEQKAAFVDKLINSGIKDSKNIPLIEETLENLSTGRHMGPTLSQLNKVAEITDYSKILAKANSFGENLVANDARVQEAIDKIGVDALNASKNNEITLSGLQKLSQKIESNIADKALNPSASTDQFYKSMQSSLQKDIISIGDKAVTNPEIDVKLVHQWSLDKGIKNIAEQLQKANLSATELPNKFNPVVNIVKDILENKVVHGLIGHTISGPVGGFAGYAIVKPIVNKVLDFLLGNPDNPSLLTKFLVKRGDSDALASYIAIDAAHAVGQKIQEIPAFFQNLASKTAIQTVPDSSSSIRRILGDQANGLSKTQQFQKLGQQISLLVSNQELRQQHINESTALFEKDHPILAQQMRQDFENRIQYLNQIMPKDPNPPQPFVKKENWKPSANDLKEFSEHLTIAQNPFALLAKLKDGSLTSKQVATASILNPAILSEIRNQIAMVAFSGKKADMTYQQKLSTSLLMGDSMDASLNNIQQLQSAYGPSQQSSMPVPAPPQAKKHKGGSHINQKNLPAAKGTMAQRISQ